MKGYPNKGDLVRSIKVDKDTIFEVVRIWGPEDMCSNLRYVAGPEPQSIDCSTRFNHAYSYDLRKISPLLSLSRVAE